MFFEPCYHRHKIGIAVGAVALGLVVVLAVTLGMLIGNKAFDCSKTTLCDGLNKNVVKHVLNNYRGKRTEIMLALAQRILAIEDQNFNRSNYSAIHLDLVKETECLYYRFGYEGELDRARLLNEMLMTPLQVSEYAWMELSESQSIYIPRSSSQLED